jgi:hypothetical protein
MTDRASQRAPCVQVGEQLGELLDSVSGADDPGRSGVGQNDHRIRCGTVGGDIPDELQQNAQPRICQIFVLDEISGVASTIHRKPQQRADIGGLGIEAAHLPFGVLG